VAPDGLSDLEWHQGSPMISTIKDDRGGRRCTPRHFWPKKVIPVTRAATNDEFFLAVALLAKGDLGDRRDLGRPRIA